jgi:Flp pilus assembly protein TadD
MIALPGLLIFTVIAGCDERIQPAASALQRNDVQTAGEILEHARVPCAKSAWFYELLGVATGMAGDSVGAEQAYRQAVLLNPKSSRLLANLGIACLGNNKLVDAVSALERSAAIDSTDARVLFTLGTLLAQQGNYARAIQFLQTIPPAAADDAVYFNLGLAYSHLRLFDPARAAYFQAIDKHPNHVEAYFRVGLDYAAMGDSRKAVPWLFRALEQGDGRGDIAYTLIEQLLRLGYSKTAQEVAAASVERIPKDPLLEVASGDTDRQTGNSASAGAKYRAALERQPSLVAALIGLAQLALDEGKEDEARVFLLDALRIEPNSPPANGELGVIELNRGNCEAAITLLKRAWDQDHSNSSFGLHLARALRQSGRYAAALQLVKSLPLTTDDSLPLHLELAQLYEKLHRPSDAQEEREIVANLQARSHEGLRFANPEIYVH